MIKVIPSHKVVKKNIIYLCFSWSAQDNGVWVWPVFSSCCKSPLLFSRPLKFKMSCDSLHMHFTVSTATRDSSLWGGKYKARLSPNSTKKSQLTCNKDINITCANFKNKQKILPWHRQMSVKHNMKGTQHSKHKLTSWTSFLLNFCLFTTIYYCGVWETHVTTCV